MKKNRNWLIWLTCLMLTFCAQTFSQTIPQTIVEPPQLFELHVKEQLKDGSFIVSIDGVEYRAITADQARDVRLNKIQNDFLKKEIALQRLNAEKAEAVAELAKQELFKSDVAKRNIEDRLAELKTHLDQETALRESCERIPKEIPCRGNILKRLVCKLSK